MRALLILLVLCWPLVGNAATVAVVELDGPIQPAAAKYVSRALSEAREMGAALVLLQIDTPGGLVTSMREICSAITESRVPVVAYVGPPGARAASAGFIIMIASDYAAMAPGTNAGAAHPVALGKKEMDKTQEKKIEEDMAALARALADARGRNADAAEKAVRESIAYTPQEALENHLIDLIAPSRADIYSALEGKELRRANGSTVVVRLKPVTEIPIRKNLFERLLSILADPQVAYMLLALAALGIYAELTHPGAILPGVVGAISAVLALYSLSILPINFAGIALLALAMVLFILELKVTSFGLLTIGGLVCFVLGSMMLFNTPEGAMKASLSFVIPVAVVVGAIMAFLVYLAVSIQRRRPVTGIEGLLGAEGVAKTKLNPHGKVLVHGEYWDAITTQGPVEEGEPVVVKAVMGTRLEVVPKQDKAFIDTSEVADD